MKKLIPAFIALILLLGCDSSSDSGNGGAGPSEAEVYFPLQIGDWWSYDAVELDSVENAIPGSQYAISSTVVGDTTASSHTYRIIQDSTNQGGNWFADERRYFRIEGDTVKSLMSFFDDPGVAYEVNMAIIPADVGESWTVLSLDTVMMDSAAGSLDAVLLWTGEVLTKGTVSVPAGTWDDAIHIGYQLNFEISNSDTSILFVMERKVWIAPNIGMVRYYEAAVNGPDGYANGTMEELVNFVAGPLP